MDKEARLGNILLANCSGAVGEAAALVSIAGACRSTFTLLDRSRSDTYTPTVTAAGKTGRHAPGGTGDNRHRGRRR